MSRVYVVFNGTLSGVFDRWSDANAALEAEIDRLKTEGDDSWATVNLEAQEIQKPKGGRK